jgi:hypothetical protein
MDALHGIALGDDEERFLFYQQENLVVGTVGGTVKSSGGVVNRVRLALDRLSV